MPFPSPPIQPSNPHLEVECSTTSAANLSLPFSMLRLVLDELADRLIREARPLSEGDEQKMLEFSSDFQRLCAKSCNAEQNASDSNSSLRANGVMLGEGCDDLVQNINTILNVGDAPQVDATLDPKETPPVHAKEIEVNNKSEELIAIFEKLDGDNSGSLNADELRVALVEAGMPKARVTKLIHQADTNQSGEVELAEWIQAVNKTVEEVGSLSKSLIQTNQSGQLFAAPTRPPWFIVHPASGYNIAWGTMILLLCLYLGTVSPFAIAWDATISNSAVTAFEFIDAVISIVFATDIILNFFTGYISGGTMTVVTDMSRIAKHYLKTWFTFDCISAFPWTIVGFPHSEGLNMIKLLKLLRIVKVVKMLAPSELDWSDLPVLDAVSSVKGFHMMCRQSKVLAQLLFLCHWMACGLKLISADDPLDATVGMLKIYKDVHGSLSKEYLASLYWAMTTLTTVGYGDICPTTDGERVYTMFAMVIGGAFYGYVVGCICSMISNIDLNTSAFNNRMDLIHAWTEKHQLPKKMKHALHHYFKHYYGEASALKEADVWHDLTPELQKQVGAYIIQKDVVANPVFDKLPPGTVVRLQSILAKVAAPKGSIIAEQGEAGTAMYMIMMGRVKLVSENANGEQTVMELGPAQSFGEEILLGFADTYEYTVTALEEVRMEIILEDEFLGVFANMPSVVERMRQNAIELHPEWGEQSSK